MAYLSATTHGLTEEASQLTLELENKNIPVPDANPNAKPFVPPKPLYPLTENWPQLTVSVGPFDTQLLSNATTKSEENFSWGFFFNFLDIFWFVRIIMGGPVFK